MRTKNARRNVKVTEVPAPDGRMLNVLEAECVRQERKVPLQSCMHCPAFKKLESAGPRPMQVVCAEGDSIPMPEGCPSSDDTALELMSPAKPIRADAALQEVSEHLALSGTGIAWVVGEDDGLLGLIRQQDIDHARSNALLPSGERAVGGIWRLRAHDVTRPALYWSCPVTPLRVIAEIMSHAALPAVPVVEDGRLIGQVLLPSVSLWLDALRSGLPLRKARQQLR